MNNTAAYIHRLDPKTVHTAATDSARTVRVQVITPPSALNREAQKQLVKEITEIVTKISGDSTQASRTWVLLTEAAEGGWRLAGTAFGKQEFAELAEGSCGAACAGLKHSNPPAMKIGSMGKLTQMTQVQRDLCHPSNNFRIPE